MTDVKHRTGHELRKIRDARTVPVSKRQTDLDRYKAIVIKGQRNFVEVGTALGLIARGNLFRDDGHASFEEMVRHAFDMAPATAYRLVNAARVVTILSQLGTIESKITNQSQALALAPLVKDREAMVRVINAAQTRTDKLTADLLTEVRVELYPATKVIDGESREGGRREIEAPPAASTDSAPEPAEDSGCEACSARLSPGIVAAAQYRCIDCDPERAHFAPDHGQPCVACAEPKPAPTDSLAGQPEVPDVPEVSPLVAHDQPETSHPSATGEAPVEVGEALPGAGQDPMVDVPSSTVDEPGGGLAGPPPGDPEATRFLAFSNDMQAIRAALLRWNAEEIAALRPEALAALHGLEALVSALAEQVELAAADAA